MNFFLVQQNEHVSITTHMMNEKYVQTMFHMHTVHHGCDTSAALTVAETGKSRPCTRPAGGKSGSMLLLSAVAEIIRPFRYSTK